MNDRDIEHLIELKDPTDVGMFLSHLSDGDRKEAEDYLFLSKIFKEVRHEEPREEALQLFLQNISPTYARASFAHSRSRFSFAAEIFSRRSYMLVPALVVVLVVLGSWTSLTGPSEDAAGTPLPADGTEMAQTMEASLSADMAGTRPTTFKMASLPGEAPLSASLPEDQGLAEVFGEELTASADAVAADQASASTVSQDTNATALYQNVYDPHDF